MTSWASAVAAPTFTITRATGPLLPPPRVILAAGSKDHLAAWVMSSGGRSTLVPASRMCPVGRRAARNRVFPGQLVTAAPAPPTRNGHPSLRRRPKGNLTTWMWHPRRINSVAGTSTPYPTGAAGRRARITSHGSVLGTQQHQAARPGHAPLAWDRRELAEDARFRARATPTPEHRTEEHCR